MLQFTKQLDYALQLIIALNKLKKGELLSLQTFAKDQKISFLFLQRTASRLREGKIISAKKGAQGGYFLHKKFAKKTFKDLIEALEGEYAVIDCLKHGLDCGMREGCESHRVFRRINKDLTKYLDKILLKEII